MQTIANVFGNLVAKQIRIFDELLATFHCRQWPLGLLCKRHQEGEAPAIRRCWRAKAEDENADRPGSSFGRRAERPGVKRMDKPQRQILFCAFPLDAACRKNSVQYAGI